jgi:DNA ligase D-like protein (predicted ligase)
MPRTKAGFIEPMLLLRTDYLPDDPAHWSYQVKFDGYRAVAFKTGGRVHLRSRNNNDFSVRYPAVIRGLTTLPNETVIDGELIALDGDGRPSFNMLQNYGSESTSLLYLVFDIMCFKGRDVTADPLDSRRELLERRVVPHLAEPVRSADTFSARLPDLIHSVKALRLEGVVAKRRDSRYEPGLRSGAWLKMRINQGQEFVIGGYTVGTKTFDALIIGYYEGDRLIYAARIRNGFSPAVREQLFKQFRLIRTAECPFANLPEAQSGRWGQGLTRDKMADCRWLKPVLVGQFEFVEWTTDNHLRHSRFIALREDKAARTVRRG